MSTSAIAQRLEDSVRVEVFEAEVATWARRLGATYRELHVRPIKRKWASCSSRGRLIFDADLPKQPAAFRAEAIVYELLHLRVPNHGRVFGSTIEDTSDKKLVKPVADSLRRTTGPSGVTVPLAHPPSASLGRYEVLLTCAPKKTTLSRSTLVRWLIS